MGQLCIYLIPFASDFSGICSAFYDLDCMSAICDASCCTSQYVYYDEPRWEKKVKPVLSCSIRNIDAVMGNDARIVDEICHAAEEIDTEIISIVGTPVPAITGMDIEGMASETEAVTGKAAFGFNTTGFSYYDKGLILAGKALIDRFAKGAGAGEVRRDDGRAECAGTGEVRRDEKKKINIIGMSPLDFGDVGNDTDFRKFLEDNGWEVMCNLFMGLTTEDLKNCAKADINLATSAAGVEIADYLNKKFAMPYVAGAPVGKDCGMILLGKLNDALSAKKKQVGGLSTECKIEESKARCSKVEGSKGRVTEAEESETKQCNADKKILIVSDQVIGNSLRDSIRVGNLSHALQIDVASFFTFKKNIAEGGDKKLKSEAELIRLLRRGKYDIVVGDPSIKYIPDAADVKFVEVPHPAMSGVMHSGEVKRYLNFEICDEIGSFI